MRSVYIPIRLSISHLTSLGTMASSQLYVCPNERCLGITSVSGSSGGQIEKLLYSGLLFTSFRILGGIADHGSFFSRPCIYSCFCSWFAEARDCRNLFHFAMRLCPSLNILHRHPLCLIKVVDEFIWEDTSTNVVTIICANSNCLITHYHWNAISSSCLSWLLYSWIVLL